MQNVRLDRSNIVEDKDIWVAIKPELVHKMEGVIHLGAPEVLLNKYTYWWKRELNKLKETV